MIPEWMSLVPGGVEALVIRRGDDAAPIGIVRYLVPHPEAPWLTIDFIQLLPQLRGWGYGSDAVRLLEQEAIRLGLATAFRADVPVGNGLALYFWLRMGYRPASRGDAFWRSDGGGDTMAMTRTPD